MNAQSEASAWGGFEDAVPAIPTRQLQAVRATLLRGGSSKGAFFLAEHLPTDPAQRAAVLLACYGSPDSRQIDGIGGADPLTSKAAIVAPSARADADVEYTFCQVGIEQPVVSTGGNCGNMLAGVGPFAILRGLVAAVEPVTCVRIFTTNTQQVVTAFVPVIEGLPSWEGDCTIAGVPGCGAGIEIDFGDCSGALSGKLLPSGHARDRIAVGDREVEVSLIDAATPFVFVKAGDVGATGRETPEQLKANAALMSRLELIRSWAAVALGLVDDPADATRKSPNVPRVMMVAPPASYVTPDGATVEGDAINACVRQLAMQRPHRALAVTGAVCAAVASAVPGCVLAEIVGTAPSPIRLGHPSGVFRVAADTAIEEGQLRVISARIERTARLLTDGFLYARTSEIARLAALPESQLAFRPSTSRLSALAD